MTAARILFALTIGLLIDRHPGNFSKYHGDFFLRTANCELRAVKQPEALSKQFAVQTPHEVRWVTVNSLARLAAAEPARKPNFVFIYTDDQRWDAMSVVQKEQGAQARFPWLKTPHMDRLAAEGFRFRNAFVVNSL